MGAFALALKDLPVPLVPRGDLLDPLDLSDPLDPLVPVDLKGHRVLQAVTVAQGRPALPVLLALPVPQVPPAVPVFPDRQDSSCSLMR